MTSKEKWLTLCVYIWSLKINFLLDYIYNVFLLSLIYDNQNQQQQFNTTVT